MENSTSNDKLQKFLYELKDLIAGAAFPFMLMLIFSASVISFSATGDFALRIVVLVVGEILLAAAYIIFGKFSGVTAARKLNQNQKKRELGNVELKVRLCVGEYSAYKGFLIGFISCVPFIIFQIIGAAVPNTFCDFILRYAFGWAFWPFGIAGLSVWLNLIWIIPLCAVHGAAYIYGAVSERKKLAVIEEAQKSSGKSLKK